MCYCACSLFVCLLYYIQHVRILHAYLKIPQDEASPFKRGKQRQGRKKSVLDNTHTPFLCPPSIAR